MRIKLPVLFIVLAVFPSSNAIAGAGDDFEIIEIKTYANMLGQRSASVTVRNSIEQGSRLVTSSDFVGITADGKRIRAQSGTFTRVEPNETHKLMLDFRKQKYPIEEVEFYP